MVGQRQILWSRDASDILSANINMNTNKYEYECKYKYEYECKYKYI